MRESDFQTAFTKWLKYHDEYHGAFELKLTKDPSIPFSAIREHQVNNLRNAAENHLIYKIPDEGYGQKPFDCFKLKNSPSYIVVMFYRRGQKTFYMIPIEAWLEHTAKAKRKSLTENDAVEIGYTCVLA